MRLRQEEEGLAPPHRPSSGLVSMAATALCLGLYHQAINDSSESCKVNSGAYLESRMSNRVATYDKGDGIVSGKWNI